MLELNLFKVKSLSCVRLFVTPWAAYQVPPSMGFSKQGYGVGCHFTLNYFLSYIIKSELQGMRIFKALLY